jgi:hypothetical protein
MQVMYCRMLEDKIADNDAWAPELLFIPANGLDVGCGLLARAAGVGAQARLADPLGRQQVEIALAAYNGGAAGTTRVNNWPLTQRQVCTRTCSSKRALLQKEYPPQ